MKIYQAVQTLLVGNRQTDILEWSKSPLMSLLHYKISSKSTNRCKRCIVLRSLKSAILKWLKLRDWTVWSQGNLQCHHVHTKFHPNPQIDSNVAPLRSLNVRLLEWSTSPSVLSPTYKLSSKSTNQLKNVIRRFFAPTSEV
jgi:hypothetical protein